MAITLVSSLSGLPPREIHGYLLLAYTRDSRAAVSSNACCVYHALADAQGVCDHELELLAPCSGRNG